MGTRNTAAVAFTRCDQISSQVSSRIPRSTARQVDVQPEILPWARIAHVQVSCARVSGHTYIIHVLKWTSLLSIVIRRRIPIKSSQAHFAAYASIDCYEQVNATWQASQQKRQAARALSRQSRKELLLKRQQEKLQAIEDRCAVNMISSTVRKYSTPNRRW